MGGVSSIQVFWDFWNLFNFAQPLRSIFPYIPKVNRNQHSEVFCFCDVEVFLFL